MGIGVLVDDGTTTTELSQHVGQGTNNLAELLAIRAAIGHVLDRRDHEIHLHTDSQWSIGILTLRWKAKVHTDLIKDIKAKLERFSNLTFHKVLGHSGIAGNERADRLATSAITRGQST